MPFYTDLATAQADGLISYWDFNEASGATIVDHAGSRTLTANNLNSHPVDGTVVSTPLGRGRDVTAYWTQSSGSDTDPIGYAFGSTTYDSNAPKLSAYSIRVVFKYKGTTGNNYQTVFRLGHLGHYVEIDPTDGNIYLWSPANNDWIKGSTPLVAGNRYDIVATCDGTTVEFFVNGASIGTLTGADDLAIDAVQGTFGVYTTSAANSNISDFGNIVLDDAGVWNRALTAQDVATLYNSGSPESIYEVPAGTLTLPIEINVIKAGSLALPLQITVESNQGSLSLPVAIDVGALGAIGLPLSVNVYDPTAAPPDTWGFQVMIDGVDWTDQIVDQIQVDAEEGAARVATLSLFAGTAFTPDSWINNRITIDYIRNGGGNRIFTGLIDTPDLDLTTGKIRLTCTDNLQATLENATYNQVDAAVGGLYHEAVFGTPGNSWDYAQNRLSTQAASYDLDVNGTGRLGQWHQATPDFMFGDDDYVSDSLSVQFGSRRDLVNSVAINFDYRFQHFRERRINSYWDWGRNFLDYIQYNTHVPTVDMIQQAIDGTGWQQLGALTVEHLPATQDVFLPTQGRHIAWINPEDVRKQQAINARFTLATRWIQDITETHSLTVRDGPNIAAVGLLQETQSYSMDLSTTVDGFEQFKADPSLPSGTIGSDKLWSSGDSSSLADAMAVAAARGKTRILASYRQNVVSFRTMLQPTLERFHHARLGATRVTAQGKVRRVRHTLDLNTGLDVTDIELAVFRRLDSNVADMPYDLAAFNYSDTSTLIAYTLYSHYGGNGQTVPDDPDWTGYVGNYDPLISGEVYDERFVVDVPEVAASSRDPIENTAAETYEIAVWQDDLTITP